MIDNRHEDSQRRADQDTAAEWIARLAANDATDRDRASFEAWLGEAPAHRRAHAEMAGLWQRLAVLADIAPPRPRGRPWPWLAAAAVVCMAVAAAWLVRQPTIVTTALAEQRTVVLGDGSRIEMNGATQVALAASNPQRDVTLTSGEAYFEVTRNAAQPFTVTTPHGRVTVLGTTFNVRIDATATLVSVMSGRVQVATTAAGTELLAGQAARAAGTVVRIDPAVAMIGTWRGGRLVYRDVTLAAMITDLNRYVPVRMALAPGSSGTQRISASLLLADQPAMLRALSTALPLDYHQVSDSLILVRSTL
jgi:transmembrane sensor